MRAVRNSSRAADGMRHWRVRLRRRLPWIAGAFNTLGFAFAVGMPLYVDPRLTSHFDEALRGRAYPDVLWIAVLLTAVCVFGLTWVLLNACYDSRWRHLAGIAPLTASLAGFIPFFRPECPHPGIISWGFLFIVISFGYSWITRFTEKDLLRAVSATADSLARRDWIREKSATYRTFYLALGAALIAALIPWVAYINEFAARVAFIAAEQLLLATSMFYTMLLTAAYVFFGPILDLLNKTNALIDYMEPDNT